MRCWFNPGIFCVPQFQFVEFVFFFKSHVPFGNMQKILN